MQSNPDTLAGSLFGRGARSFAFVSVLLNSPIHALTCRREYAQLAEVTYTASTTSDSFLQAVASTSASWLIFVVALFPFFRSVFGRSV